MMCGQSSPRVIKTIRLRRPGLLPWILTSEVRVVHLVRDPRAIITSVAKVSDQLTRDQSQPLYHLSDQSRLAVFRDREPGARL